MLSIKDIFHLRTQAEAERAERAKSPEALANADAAIQQIELHMKGLFTADDFAKNPDLAIVAAFTQNPASKNKANLKPWKEADVDAVAKKINTQGDLYAAVFPFLSENGAPVGRKYLVVGESESLVQSFRKLEVYTTGVVTSKLSSPVAGGG